MLQVRLRLGGGNLRRRRGNIHIRIKNEYAVGLRRQLGAVSCYQVQNNPSGFFWKVSPNLTGNAMTSSGLLPMKNIVIVNVCDSVQRSMS